MNILSMYVEGPLPYRPHVVHPIGCVIKPCGKVRNCVDARRSNFNKCLRKLYVKYSAVDDVVRRMLPGCYINKINLTDAFFVRPVDARECDYLGIKHVGTNDFYRYRFAPFGISTSPWSMQRLASEIKRLLSTHGLQFVKKTLPDGSCNPAADYAGFRCAAAYLDDFALVHPPHLTKAQADEQYASVLQFMQSLGRDLVKVNKCEWPSTRAEFLGITLDSKLQLATISDDRASKLQRDIDDFLELSERSDSKVSRRELARVCGRLQFVAPYVNAGQLALSPLYESRDAFVVPPKGDARSAWSDDTKVHVTLLAQASLADWKELLSSPTGRKVYLSSTGFNSAFWEGSTVTASDSEIDETSQTEEGVTVITTDASGFAGGAWWKHRRLQYAFDPTDRAPHTSANWRELHTIVESVRTWGPRLTDRRVLIRTDSSTCVSVIRRKTSSSAGLRLLLRQLVDLTTAHGIDLAARHIPGEKNLLSDGLSRWQRHFDDQDWMFSREQFDVWDARFGPHAVDACCEPTGKNSLVSAYWSEVDSALSHSWRGKNVWCNPPFAQAGAFLAHALDQHSQQPHQTSATFVLPHWPWATWWHLTSFFERVGYYKTGSRLFTSPDWLDSSTAVRADRGPTRWPVVVLRLSPRPPVSRRAVGTPPPRD